MKKLLFLLLLAIPLSGFTSLHKFYVSSTDISYNEELESVEVISRVFIDDMEKLLQKRYNKDLFLLKKGEHKLSDSYLQKYFHDKLNIKVEGKERQLQYIGKEYDNDQLILYFEIPEVEPFKKISVENTVLSDLFPEQKNVVKVERNNEIKSLLLGSFNPSGSLIFEN